MFEYDAVNAKSRAMAGRLFTAAQYRELAEKQTLDEAGAYLRDSSDYSHLFEDADMSRIHRSQLEDMLENEYYDVYLRLYKFSRGKLKQFIHGMLEEFYLKGLLTVVRTMGESDEKRYRALPKYLFGRPGQHIDFSLLLDCKNRGELYEALGCAWYSDALRPFLQDEIPLDIARMEAAFYNAYYSRMFCEYASLLDRRNAAVVRGVIDKKIELLNEESRRRTAPFQLANPDVYLLNRPQTKRRGLLPKILPEPASRRIAGASLYDCAAFLLSQGGTGIGTLLALFMMKDFEVKNLTYIIEGIRYGLDAGAILKNITI